MRGHETAQHNSEIDRAVRHGSPDPAPWPDRRSPWLHLPEKDAAGTTRKNGRKGARCDQPRMNTDRHGSRDHGQRPSVGRGSPDPAAMRDRRSPARRVSFALRGIRANRAGPGRRRPPVRPVCGVMRPCAQQRLTERWARVTRPRRDARPKVSCTTRELRPQGHSC